MCGGVPGHIDNKPLGRGLKRFGRPDSIVCIECATLAILERRALA